MAPTTPGGTTTRSRGPSVAGTVSARGGALYLPSFPAPPRPSSVSCLAPPSGERLALLRLLASLLPPPQDTAHVPFPSGERLADAISQALLLAPHPLFFKGRLAEAVSRLCRSTWPSSYSPPYPPPPSSLPPSLFPLQASVWRRPSPRPCPSASARIYWSRRTTRSMTGN